MEVAESEKDALDSSFFLFDVLLAEVGEGSLEVLLDSHRWLVCELDGLLQQTDRNGGGWI